MIVGVTISIIILIIIFLICCAIASSGNAFRDNSQKIQVGMTKEEVLSIMGDPSYVKQHQDGSTDFVYEKSEWKGWMRGGTQTRRMEIVISSSNYVISIGKNANCDKSGW